MHICNDLTDDRSLQPELWHSQIQNNLSGSVYFLNPYTSHNFLVHIYL